MRKSLLVIAAIAAIGFSEVVPQKAISSGF